jgi:Spy/CpxP family protein refolding chaperone
MRTRFGLAIAAAVLGMVITSGTLHAQAGPGGRKGKVEKAAAALGLSEDQKQKLQALRLEFAPKRKQIQQDLKAGGITKEQARERTKALVSDFQARLSTILTPTQMEQAKQGFAKMKQNRQGAAGNGSGKMMQNLNLTDLQKADFKAIRKTHQDAVQAVRKQVQSGALTQQQAKEKMKALRQDMMTQIKSKLTPEQQQKAEEWLNNRPSPGAKKQNKGTDTKGTTK